MSDPRRDPPTDPFRAWADFLGGAGGDDAPGGGSAGGDPWRVPGGGPGEPWTAGRGAAADWQQLSLLMWRSTTELLRLWSGMLGAMTQASRNPGATPWNPWGAVDRPPWAPPSSPGQSSWPWSGAQRPAAAPAPWAVLIDAPTRVAVHADLAADAAAHDLAVSPVRRVDGQESATPRVTLEPADPAGGRPATLRVEVDDGVPAAVYRAGVLARADGRSCGEVEVQVFGPDPGPDRGAETR